MTATKCAVSRLLLLVAIVGGFTGSGCQPNRMQMLLDKVAHASEADLPKLIYGYDKSSPGAQKILLGLITPLHAPSPQQNMRVEAIRQSGRFTMIVAHVPWPHMQKGELLPILVTGDAKNEQVVGYILPFDDLLPLMQGTDMHDIGELSMFWITDYAQRGR